MKNIFLFLQKNSNQNKENLQKLEKQKSILRGTIVPNLKIIVNSRLSFGRKVQVAGVERLKRLRLIEAFVS